MKTFKQLTEDKKYDFDDMTKLALISALGFGGSAEIDQEKLLRKLEKQKLVKDIEISKDVNGDHISYDLTPAGKNVASSMRKEKSAIMKRIKGK